MNPVLLTLYIDARNDSEWLWYLRTASGILHASGAKELWLEHNISQKQNPFALKQNQRGSPIVSSQSSPPRLILCVDDETIGLQVRRILLERAGYRVLTAPDGPSGLELFSREPVEAVVLDFSMPGMTGGEVALNMRQRKPHVPILMLSAYMGLPQEVTDSVNLYMTKGEGAPALLRNLSSLVPPAALAAGSATGLA